MADLLSDDPRVADLVNETEALRARVAELEALVLRAGALALRQMRFPAFTNELACGKRQRLPSQ